MAIVDSTEEADLRTDLEDVAVLHGVPQADVRHVMDGPNAGNGRIRPSRHWFLYRSGRAHEARKTRVQYAARTPVLTIRQRRRKGKAWGFHSSRAIVKGWTRTQQRTGSSSPLHFDPWMRPWRRETRRRLFQLSKRPLPRLPWQRRHRRIER